MQTNTNEHKIHQGVDSMAAGAHQAVDRAASAAGKAADSLSDTGHDIKETQEKWLAVAREYVQENPATALGIALAGGYLLSRLLRAD